MELIYLLKHTQALCQNQLSKKRFMIIRSWVQTHCRRSELESHAEVTNGHRITARLDGFYKHRLHETNCATRRVFHDKKVNDAKTDESFSRVCLQGGEAALPRVGPRRRHLEVHGDYSRRLAPPVSCLIASPTLMGSIYHRAEALSRSEPFARACRSSLPASQLVATEQKRKALVRSFSAWRQTDVSAASELGAVRGWWQRVKCFGDACATARGL